MYVSDAAQHRVCKIGTQGKVTTLAGSTMHHRGYRDGLGQDSRFDTPTGLAVDVNGTVFVADTKNGLQNPITIITN